MPPIDLRERPLRLLAVSPDHQVRAELEAALDGIQGSRAITFLVESVHHGIEAARNREPDVICVDLRVGLGSLRTFVDEARHAAPNAAIAGVYDRAVLDEDGGDGQIFIESMRAGVADFLRRPISSAELAQVLSRSTQSSTARAPLQLGRVVSFVSTKGGVGKSTISGNVACVLGRRNPGQVLLIDGSLQLGVCASMFNIEARTTIADATRELDRLDETLLRKLATPHESGVAILPSPADAIDAIEVTEERFARVLATARRAYAYVIVDTFPLIDGVVVGALDLSDLVYIIAQPTVPSVVGLARLGEVLGGLGVHPPRLKTVLNNGFPRFSGALRVNDVARRLGGALDHIVPYDSGAVRALNTGQPLALKRWGLMGFGRAVRRIADEVERFDLAKAPAEAKPGRRRAANSNGDGASQPSESIPLVSGGEARVSA